MKGFIVYSNHIELEGKTYVQIYGRLENNESFAILKEFNPYFFVRKKDTKKIQRVIKKYKSKIRETKGTTFDKEEIIEVISSSQEIQNKLTKELHDSEIETFEADIRPQMRFMIDNNLLGNINIEGDYEVSRDQRVNRFYKNPEIAPADGFKVNLKTLSLDIESGKEDGQLFCVGLYSKGYEKTFIISDQKVKGAISCKDVGDCLEKLKSEIIDFDPDVITGWNLIDFDFMYLKTLFEKNKIKMDIGRDDSNARLRIEGNFFRNSSMDVRGRVVLDGLSFIKDPFIQEAPLIKFKKLDSYTLEDVSQAFLGKGKLISSKDRHKEIEELYKSNKQKLVEYNIQDCILAYEILEKTKMIDLSIERSELTGIQIDKLTASIAPFDSLYIREARKRGLVSPTTRFTDKQERIKGGFVMTPKPGIYHNVLVLDFKSLYPSIIKTFNIDPSSFLKEEEKNCIVSPNGACFKNQEGILPQIIERLHQAREKAKKEKRELSSFAIKIIMNSFFGVLASPNSRYFDLKMANAITNFGQEIIKLTAKRVEEMGYEVIYGDTDSIFVNTNLEKKDAGILGERISKEIGKFYEVYVKERYNRKSYLDLEFDKLFLSLLMPRLRVKTGEEKGAKKRYAGLIEEKGTERLDIVGLEAIRGDWTEAAQEFQKQLLFKVFYKEDPISFIKKFIKNLSSGELDKKLVYRKSIRKELKEYTKTTPPHVRAARKLDQLEGNIIEYYITEDGPEPLQKLKSKIDYNHYIEKQIKPIAKTILETINVNPEKAFSDTRQETLF